MTLLAEQPACVVAMEACAISHSLLTQMGNEGRHQVERDYTLQVWGPRVAQMLHDVVSQGGQD